MPFGCFCLAIWKFFSWKETPLDEYLKTDVALIRTNHLIAFSNQISSSTWQSFFLNCLGEFPRNYGIDRGRYKGAPIYEHTKAVWEGLPLSSSASLLLQTPLLLVTLNPTQWACFSLTFSITSLQLALFPGWSSSGDISCWLLHSLLKVVVCILVETPPKCCRWLAFAASWP